MKIKQQYRDVRIDTVLDDDSRTIEFSFSSDAPVERYFGKEVLLHGEGNIDFTRLKSGGSLLTNHDHEKVIGVIERAWVEDGRGRVAARFGKSPYAEEIYQDVKDGIRSNVSVGYFIQEMEEAESEVYNVTRWQPFEVSIVTVPADASVGIGRSGDLEEKEVVVRSLVQDDDNARLEKVKDKSQESIMSDINVEEVRAEAVKAEQARTKEIQALGEKTGMVSMARKFIEDGSSAEAFRATVLEQLTSAKATVVETTGSIGLTEKEARSFSISKAINAMANPSDMRAREAAKFEFEVSEATAKALGRSAQGVMLPDDITTRAMTVGSAPDGGNVVDTELMSGSFIDMLRNRSVMLGLGTTMNGLVGDIAIPRQNGLATAYWLAENGAPTESSATIEQIGMTPKTIGAYTDISRKLLIQSSIDVESFIQRELVSALSLAIDLAAINGTGTANQPKGILNQTGLNIVELGANGAAPDWAKLVQLETEVALDNADVDSMRYIMNAKMRGFLKSNVRFANTGLTMWDGLDYQASITNQVPYNLTKGTGTDLSAMLFGNFRDLMIGMWSGVDMIVDPYTNSTSGAVRVTTLQDMDINVRRPESFSAFVDAIV